jgi:hypothetical protein
LRRRTVVQETADIVFSAKASSLKKYFMETTALGWAFGFWMDSWNTAKKRGWEPTFSLPSVMSQMDLGISYVFIDRAYTVCNKSCMHIHGCESFIIS